MVAGGARRCVLVVGRVREYVGTVREDFVRVDHRRFKATARVVEASMEETNGCSTDLQRGKNETIYNGFKYTNRGGKHVRCSFVGIYLFITVYCTRYHRFV